MRIRCADHVTPLYPQKLALTSPTGGGRSVGIVRLRTKATEFFFIGTFGQNDGQTYVAKIISSVLNCFYSDTLKMSIQRHILHSVVLYVMTACIYREYSGCNRRNGPDFGRVFLMLNYTEKLQNTYIQIWMVSEIMASEVWNFDSCYTLTDYQIHIETGRNMWFL